VTAAVLTFTGIGLAFNDVPHGNAAQQHAGAELGPIMREPWQQPAHVPTCATPWVLSRGC
jgi:hypothetical protein